MRNIILLLLAFGSLGLVSLSAQGAVTPLSVGLLPPVQFPSEDFTITGVRGSLLWGKHRDVYGLDLGLLGNVTDQAFVGVGLAGIFNATHGNTTILGLQAAGVTNINKNKTDVVGLQFAFGLNLNTATSSVTGLQLALVNQSAFTDIRGFQIGAYNRAQEVYGLQIGLVNFTSNLHGIQIGLLNFNDKGLFKVSPLINVGW